MLAFALYDFGWILIGKCHILKSNEKPLRNVLAGECFIFVSPIDLWNLNTKSNVWVEFRGYVMNWNVDVMWCDGDFVGWCTCTSTRHSNVPANQLHCRYLLLSAPSSSCNLSTKLFFFFFNLPCYYLLFIYSIFWPCLCICTQTTNNFAKPIFDVLTTCWTWELWTIYLHSTYLHQNRFILFGNHKHDLNWNLKTTTKNENI